MAIPNEVQTLVVAAERFSSQTPDHLRDDEPVSLHTTVGDLRALNEAMAEVRRYIEQEAESQKAYERRKEELSQPINVVKLVLDSYSPQYVSIERIEKDTRRLLRQHGYPVERDGYAVDLGIMELCEQLRRENKAMQVGCGENSKFCAY